ncbi:MAG TPA: hypothetical protein VMA95_20990 [Streptosporangiaceae bacterium]|nr:hypothetical protein [Streptosporangiaceae bacterium]
MSYRDVELETRQSFEAELAGATRQENLIALKALIPVLIVVLLVIIRLFGL